MFQDLLEKNIGIRFKTHNQYFAIIDYMNNTVDFLFYITIFFLIYTITLFILCKFYFTKARKEKYSRKKRKLLNIVDKSKYVTIVFIVGFIVYIFILPPKVDSISLKDGETWLDYNKPIEITFNRPINQSDLNNSFSTQFNTTHEFAKINKWHIFKRKLIIQPKETLFPNEEVEMNLNYKNLLQIGSTNYKTNFISGTSTPEVKVSKNINNRQNVNPLEHIRYKISRADSNSYLIEYESQPKIQFRTFVLEDQSKMLIPKTPYKNGEQYEVTLYSTPIAYDIDTQEETKRGERNELAKIGFKIAPSPKIEEVLPNTENTLASESIKITFNTKMNKESVEKGITISPEIETEPVWDETQKIITLKPKSPLQKETTYSISISPDIESDFGAKMMQKEYIKEAKSSDHQFTTTGSVGVLSTTPGAGAYDVSVNSDIRVTFTQEVNKQSAQSKFSITPQLEGGISWDGNTMIFRPSSKLSHAQVYTANVQAVVESIDGLALKAPYSFNFTVEPKVVILDVPVIGQTHQYSCNVTAAAIALQYKGVSVSPDQVLASIPKQNVPKKDGKWGNPNLGFVGNVDGPTGEGYGVHWGPIANYISQHRPTETKFGWNTTDLLREIDNGNVSILWWQNGHANPAPLSWKTKDGNGNEITINTVNGMHSEVVVGYVGSPENPSQIIISDPWASRWGNQYRYIDINSFRGLWSYFGNTAILVR